MKITSSRKDDIIRRRDEFDRRKKEYEDIHEEEYNRYRTAQYEVTEGAKRELEDIMAPYKFSDLEIRVEDGRFSGPGIHVSIRVHDRNVHDKHKALSWTYEASLGEEGEVIRETSSWSGLQAVTSEQLDDLENTLKCLKMLAGLDWEKFLNRSMPNWQDYVKTTLPEDLRRRPDFESEIRHAELEDLVGARKFVEVLPFNSSWYEGSDKWGRRGNVYVAIVKDSGSQYTIKECPRAYVEKPDEYPGEVKKMFDSGDTHRVKKSQIIPVEPLHVIDVGV